MGALCCKFYKDVEPFSSAQRYSSTRRNKEKVNSKDDNQGAKKDEVKCDKHKGLLMADLTDDIFNEVCGKLGVKYISWEMVDFQGDSISGTVYGSDSEKITGVKCLEITCEENGTDKKIRVVLKAKAPGEETAEKYVQVSHMAGPEAGDGMQRFVADARSTVLKNHLVEPTMAQKAMTDEVIRSISPEIYYVHIDEEGEKYFFIMEYVDREHYTHLNTITQPGIDFFDEEATKKALKGIAIFHGAFLDQPERWQDFVVMDYLDVSKDYPDIINGWGKFNLASCNDVLTEDRAALYQKLLDNFELIVTELGKNKKTVVHNDFTPMNCCLRKDPGSGKQELCAYDWEVMSLSVPQRDVIDFLTFGLMMAPPDVALAAFKGYMEYYRLMLLNTIADRDADLVKLVTAEDNFYKTVDYAFMLHMLERFANFMMISKIMPIPFLPMMANFLFSYLESIVNKHPFLKTVDKGEGSADLNGHKGLVISDLTDDIFKAVCMKLGTKFISWKMVDLKGESISSTVFGGDSEGITGVRCIEITCEENGKEKHVKVVLKAKAPGTETAEKYVQVSHMAGPEAGEGMQRFVADARGTVLRNHLVEPTMAQKAMTDEVIRSISPEIYYVHIDEEGEKYFFIMEYVDREHYTHLNTITQPGIDFFDEEATKKALKGIAIFHGAFLDQPERWQDFVVMDYLEVSKDYPDIINGWGKFNLASCNDVLTEDRAALYQKLLDNFELIVTELGKNKKTVVHNDFTPMNCCLRKDPKYGKQELCAYDWEVMSLSVPQRDVIDFLTFGLMMAPPDVAVAAFKGYMEYYRLMLLNAITDRDADLVKLVTAEDNFYKTVDYAFMLHMLERFANFMMISKIMPIPFLPMMANFLFSYLESIVDKHPFLKAVDKGEGSADLNGHKGLVISDLTNDIFNAVCMKLGTKFISWKMVDLKGESISSTVFGGDSEGITGVRCIEITCEENGKEKHVKVVLKAKAPGRETAEKYVQVSHMAGPEAGEGMQRFVADARGTVLKNHLVEPTMAQKAMTDEVIRSISPEIYYVHIDEEGEKYFFIMEYVDREHYTHLNTITQPGIDFFDEEATKKALKGIAIFHGAFLDQPERWQDFVVMDYLDVSKDYPDIINGWGKFNLASCNDVLTEDRAALYQKLLDNFELIVTELGKNKKTVVHNDFTPMNCCLRKNPGSGKQELCAYDWEVMSLSVPQRDVIDFLTFGLMMAPPDVALVAFKGYMEYYRLMLLNAIADREADLVKLVTAEDNFYKTVDYAFMLHMLERFANFMMISKIMPIPFLPMMANFLFLYLESIVDKYAFLQTFDDEHVGKR